MEGILDREPFYDRTKFILYVQDTNYRKSIDICAAFIVYDVRCFCTQKRVTWNVFFANIKVHFHNNNYEGGRPHVLQFYIVYFTRITASYREHWLRM